LRNTPILAILEYENLENKGFLPVNAVLTRWKSQVRIPRRPLHLRRVHALSLHAICTFCRVSADKTKTSDRSEICSTKASRSANSSEAAMAKPQAAASRSQTARDFRLQTADEPKGAKQNERTEYHRGKPDTELEQRHERERSSVGVHIYKGQKVEAGDDRYH